MNQLKQRVQFAFVTKPLFYKRDLEQRIQPVNKFVKDIKTQDDATNFYSMLFFQSSIKDNILLMTQ